MVFFLFLGLIFISFFFYRLSSRYEKSVFLNTLLGVFVFLFTYFISSFIIVILINTWIRVHSFNETITACFTIPVSVMISGIVYKLMESNFKKNQNIVSVEDIGKKDEMNL